MKGYAEVMEILADEAHKRWSHWQKYLHSKCVKNPDGSLTIPASLVERWERQIATDYKDLSEKEKDSDREQARNVFTALAQPVSMEPLEDWSDAHIPKLQEDIKTHASMYLGIDDDEQVESLTRMVLTSLRCRLGNNVVELSGD